MNRIQSRGPMPADTRQHWEQGLKSLDLPQIESAFADCEAAAREASFSGFVRRSIHQAALPLSLIAERSQIGKQRLADFLRGRGTLESLELDRLLEILGVELVTSSN